MIPTSLASRLRSAVALVQEGSLYALLFLLPFSKAALEIAFGGLLVTWLFMRLDPKTRTHTLWLQPQLRPLLAAAVTFLAACTLSVLASTDPALSFRGLTRKWLEYLVLFIIVTDVGSRPGVARRSLGVLAASACLVIFEGVTQERFGYGFFRNYRLDFFRRMTGPYESPIDLATYLMVIIPPLVVYTFLHRGVARWRMAVLTLAVISCLARAASIGAWLGLGVGLVVMSRWRTALPRHARAVLAVALVMAGTFLVMTGRLSRVFSTSDVGKQDRWAMWQSALRMTWDRPILGQGVNTFMANYLHYWVGGQQQPRYAHNCYLQMAAETGLVGLGTFLWLLWSMVGLWRRAMRWMLSRDPPDFLLMGWTAGLTAFLVQAAVDTNFYSLRQAFLFWTLAGIATGLAARNAAQPSPSFALRASERSRPSPIERVGAPYGGLQNA